MRFFFSFFKTPDGIVRLKHWYALLKLENPRAYTLKANYKLSEKHIKPECYEKMNVALAFQVCILTHVRSRHNNINRNEDGNGERLLISHVVCNRYFVKINIAL